MAKDMPNKPENEKNQSVAKKPDQHIPIAESSTAKILPNDKVTASAGKSEKTKSVTKPKPEPQSKKVQESTVNQEKSKDTPINKTDEQTTPSHPVTNHEPTQKEPLKETDKKGKPDEKKKIAPKQPKEAEKPKNQKQKEETTSQKEVTDPQPKEAPRSEKPEQITYLKLSDLHAFKDHPFQVRDDEEMRAMVESVKDKGVTQPAIVRPREGGGYEIVSGHRRQKASQLAGYTDMPCIIRNLSDEQAITQMVEDNTNQRENILPSEKAKALKMQLDAIKRQGVRDANGNGQRSNEVVAQRNKMTVKQVQRFIKLNELVPELMKLADEGSLKFTPAVELAFIQPKNQRYIALAIEAQQSSPNLSQAKRLRDLDQKKLLNPDIIDGIMLEEKKEVDKVILTSQELSKYFGQDKTPQEMKKTILKLLDEWQSQQKSISPPETKVDRPEK